MIKIIHLGYCISFESLGGVHGRQRDGAGGGRGLEVGVIVQPGGELGDGPVRNGFLGVVDHLHQGVDGLPAFPLRTHSRRGLRAPSQLGQHLIQQFPRVGSGIPLRGAVQLLGKISY